MTKKIMTILTLAMMFIASQTLMAQDVQKSQSDLDAATTNITVNKSVVRIKALQGSILEIYDLTGVKVKTIRIDSADKTIELDDLQKGCYILKVGKIVRKSYIS